MRKFDTIKYSKELILELIPKSSSRRDLAIKLGLALNGGNMRSLRKLCKLYDIDLTIFDTKLSKEKYNNAPKYCKCCGKIIPYEKRDNIFCSSSCAAKYNNTNREVVEKTRKKISESLQRRSKNFNGIYKSLSKRSEACFKRKFIEKQYCLNCGKELNGLREKFCNYSCQRRYYHNEYIKRWQNGEENGVAGKYGISAHIRKYFLEKYNCKCQLCGWSKENPYTNTIPLEIHHIDGDYTNNKEENLQLLCPNCHSLTDTYKSHNKSGRKDRNKYN